MNPFAFFTDITNLIGRAKSIIPRAEAIIAQLEAAVTTAEGFLNKLAGVEPSGSTNG